MKDNLLIAEQSGIFQSQFDKGLELADTPDEQGGLQSYFSESDYGDLRIEDERLRSNTALMLENAKRWVIQECGGRSDDEGRMVIDESTTSSQIGGFVQQLLPIIRAAFPSNPLNDLVSVQPTTQRNATIAYYNWIVGSNKGTFTKGQRLFDAITGPAGPYQDYSSNRILGESLGAGPAAAAMTAVLAYHDGGGVIPGTVYISLTHSGNSVVVFADNGQGGFVQSSGTATTLDVGTINYNTGAIALTANSGTFTSAVMTATYAWESEGSDSLPEIDIQITTSSTQVERRALKINYSREAQYDLQAQFGRNLEADLVSGVTAQLNSETCRQVITEMWNIAPVTGVFPVYGSNQFNQQDHFRDLIYILTQASNRIWGRSQLGYGNWLVIDEGAANIIESLPLSMFEAAPPPADARGVHFVGTLLKKYRVYKDLYLLNQTGASPYGNILMGRKGNDGLVDAGYVWAPYQMMYMTPVFEDANFKRRQGFATRYARKVVNPNMFARVSVSAEGVH